MKSQLMKKHVFNAKNTVISDIVGNRVNALVHLSVCLSFSPTTPAIVKMTPPKIEDGPKNGDNQKREMN